MLFSLLLISVISLIISIYKLMENSSLRFIVAPVVGLLFGYFVYSFALGIHIVVLIPILISPVIAMIVLLNN